MIKKQRLKAESVKILTPEFQASFPNLFTPKAAPGSDKLKYSLVMLFQVKETAKSKAEGRKVVDIKPLKDAVSAVLAEKFGPDKSKWPPFGDGPGLFKLPFRSGEEPGKKDAAGLGEGIMFINATKNGDQIKPGIVHAHAGPDNRPAPLTVPTDFYGGCYARATVNPYFWEYMGRMGVSFGLQNVQKLRDGEPFGGGVAAENEFDAIQIPGGATPAGVVAATGDPLGL